MTGTIGDLRYAARGLRRDPTFTIAAIATLALALGSNAAILNLSWAVLFRSLPYGEPERIVAIENPPLAFSGSGFVPGAELRDSPVLESAALYYDANGANLETAAEPLRIRIAQVSGTFLRTLGSTPLIGRDFAPEEAVAGANRVILLSEPLWRLQYGRDPGIIGATVRLNGIGYTVIGVMAPSFELPAGAEAWVPLPMTWEFVTGSASSPSAIGRLRLGVDPGTAEAWTEAAVTRRRAREPGESPVRLVPLKDALTGSLRTPLLVLMAAVATVLLIGCVNLSGLMLARAQARAHEFAVRGALGAGFGSIARLQIAEALLLAMLGAAAAFLLVTWTMDGILALFPARLLPTADVAPDGWVLASTAAAALVAALAFALPAALHAARAGQRLARDRTAAEGPQRLRLRSGLLVAQVALGFVLLTGAALLGRTMVNLYDVPLGFQPDRVLTVRVTLPLSTYETGGQWTAFGDRLLERVRGLPAVDHAALGSAVPLSGEMGVRFRISHPSETEEEVMARPYGDRSAVHQTVSPDWFRTMGVALRAGRGFTADDGRGEPVVAISESLATQLFPGEPPVGRAIRIWKGRTPIDATVIGVVADIRGGSVDADMQPHIYEPLVQAASNVLALVVRHRGSGPALARAVRGAVHDVDPALPLYDVRGLDAVVAASLGSRRGVTFVMSAFGVLALALSAVGLYGLVAQSVTQRRREIGVRMALGARRTRILRMVLHRGLRLAALGTVIGIAGAALATRALRSLLFGVQPLDAATFAGASAVMLATAAAACLLPAGRAARVDPIESLRE